MKSKIFGDNLLSLKDLLDNRKQRILSTIRNSEELRRGTLEQLEKARIRPRARSFSIKSSRNKSTKPKVISRSPSNLP